MRSKVERVFVTENEINALAFSPVRSSMVVFAGGYAIERLAQAEWLHGPDLVDWRHRHAWIAILDHLRASMPHARLVLMDAQTLHAHRAVWVSEDSDKRFLGDLSRLTDAEQALFMQLHDNVHSEGLRLEQERIGYGCAVGAIRRSVSNGPCGPGNALL